MTARNLDRLKSALTLAGQAPRQVLERAWSQLNTNEVFTRAAAIAYYAMLASVPFLAVLITLAVRMLPPEALVGSDVSGRAVGQFQATVQQALPPEAAAIVTDQIKRMRARPPVGLLSFGLLVTLWTASSLFLAVIDAMNRMYGVRETRSLARLRLLAVAMTLIQAVLLLAAVVAIVAGPEILQGLGLHGPAQLGLALVAQYLAVLVVILLSFAVTYYVAPDVEQEWEWITPGSLYGTLALIAVTLVFRLYVQNFGNYEATYGSLAGVMVLLLWLWVAALVLLAGAQLNQVVEEASPQGKLKGQKALPDADHDGAHDRPRRVEA